MPTPTCPEMDRQEGQPFDCETAYTRHGCRCETCIEWRYAQEDATPPAETEGGDPGGKPRDEKGRFASTALTRKRDAAIAELGEETVYGMVEIGMPVREIANMLGLDGSDVTARQAVYSWLQRDSERYEEAKRRSVDALAEKAGEVYGDEAPETTADSKWRNDRSGYYRWLAELRAGFKDGGAHVNVNIGALHLDALRSAGSMDRGEEEPGGVVEADYEIEGQEHAGRQP